MPEHSGAIESMAFGSCLESVGRIRLVIMGSMKYRFGCILLAGLIASVATGVALRSRVEKTASDCTPPARRWRWPSHRVELQSPSRVIALFEASSLHSSPGRARVASLERR